MNIRASNNYFDKKKEQYRTSKIAIANDLANLPKDNWIIADIDNRNKEVSKQLSNIFEKWINSFGSVAEEQPAKPTPTAEQAEMIRQLKEAGLI